MDYMKYIIYFVCIALFSALFVVLVGLAQGMIIDKSMCVFQDISLQPIPCEWGTLLIEGR
jgi:hypothetical protein